MLTVAFLHYLAGLGLASWPPSSASVTGDSPGYDEDLPPNPDELVAVFELPGPAPADLSGYLTPIVHVVYRGAPEDRVTPKTLARQAFRALDGLAEVVLGEGTEDEVEVLTVDAIMSAPRNLGPDALDRPRWAVEFRVEYLPED